MPPSVSIVQGLSAGGCFTQAFPPGGRELLVHQDVLTCGPLAPLTSIEEWRRMREGYWRSMDPNDPFSFADFDRDLLTNAGSLAE